MSSAPDPSIERLVPKPGPSPWLFVILAVLAFGCMAGAIIMPIMASAGRNVNDANCQANLRSLAEAALMYASENDERLPIANWHESLKKFHSDDLLYACPVQRRIDPRSSGYALSQKVAGQQRSKFERQEEEIMLFDSVLTQPGVVGDPGQAPRPGRHGNGSSNNVVYLDGHIKSIQTP